MKRCPYCAEEIQDAAVVCRHCGRDLAPAKAPPTQVVVVPPKRRTSCIAWGCLAIIIIIVLSAIFGSVIPSASRPERKRPARTPPVAAEAVPAAVVVDVPAIAGKSQAEVADVLGQPTSSETIRNQGRQYPKKVYRDGDIEIVYVQGKADWITIYGHGSLPFSRSILGALNLPDTAPTFSNPAAVIRWENIAGLREVNANRGEGRKVSFVYILSRTKP